MMTTPMDNVSSFSHLTPREHVERLLKKNVELENKRKKAAQAGIPSNPSTWQQMRENYEVIILEDLAFSEKHEIELALWQLHYWKIEEVRAHLGAARTAAVSTSSQNGKGSTRAGPDRISKIRSQFKTFLSEATGFYHDLMVKIRAKYGLPLDFFSSDYGNQVLSKDGNISADVKQSLISSHRCLIYLGDLARYKGSFGEPESKEREYASASSYYTQATSLWPASGNPHHQLAILALYSGDELVAIYRYFRSLSVDNPFTTARDNLTIAFERNRQSYLQLGSNTNDSVKSDPVKVTGKGRGRGETRVPKINAVEAILVNDKPRCVSDTLKLYKVRFIRLNGILFTRTSLETFEEVSTSARKDLLQLLSSGPEEDCNFGSDMADCRLVIIRMVAVLIFTVHNVKRESKNQSYAEILQRSLLLQNAFTAIFEFMGDILERCIQLNDPSTSYMLPGILVFVEWLACQQDIAVCNEAEENQNRARSSFWNLFVSFSNKLLSVGGLSMTKDEEETCFFDMSRYDESETTNRLALFEDFELKGFLPLVPAQQILDFSRKHSLESDDIKEMQARVHRIIAAGKALSNVAQEGQHGIYFDSKAKRFTVCRAPQISNDHLLSSSLDMPGLNGDEESFQGSEGSSVVSELKPQLFTEGEEEDDEEIVFKPAVSDKHANGVVAIPPSSEVLSNGVNTEDVGLRSCIGPASVSYDELLLQGGFTTSSGFPLSLAKTSTQNLQPAQPTAAVQPTASFQPAASNWLVDKEVPLVKELRNLSLYNNEFSVTQGFQDRYGAGWNEAGFQDRYGALQPADVSIPFPSVNASSGIRYSVPFPETAAPSKFSSFVSSGVGMDSLSVKASTIAPAGLKKNPVSRPVRHSGPPPGFSSIRAKQVDDMLPDMALKNYPPTVDDYSWLDGYKVPSTTHGIGFNSNINQPTQLCYPMNKSNNSYAETNFPFPGKRMQPLSMQGDKQNGWQEYQFSKQLKVYQEQQKQLESGNQQSTALPEHYNGQPLWEGHFFV